MPGPEYTRWLELGREHQAAARPIDAMLCFRRAMRVEPPALEARHHLGECLWTLGLTGDALAVWTELTDAEPKWHRPSVALAEARLAVGDDAGAIVAAERALAADAQDSRAALVLAIARVAGGAGGLAVDDLAERLTARPRRARNDVLGRAIARALDRVDTSAATSAIAAALAPQAAELPVPLLARIAEHLTDPAAQDGVVAAMHERAIDPAEHDALRRVARALASRDPAAADAMAHRYAELCAQAFPAAVPLPWPLRAAGTALRVAVLATSRSDPRWEAVRRALDDRAAMGIDVTLFVPAPGSGDRGADPTGALEVSLPLALGLDAARIVARDDPDVLVDLVGLALDTGPLLAARPARAIWTLATVPLPNVAPLVDRRIAAGEDVARALAAALGAAVDAIRRGPSCSASAAELSAEWEQAVRAHEQGDADAAKARCAWLLEREPEFAPALSMLGAIAQREGRDDDALTWFRRALASAPDHAETRATAARLVLAHGDFGAARTLAAEGLGRRPQDAALWRQLGHAELAGHDGEAAANAFARALALAPADGETHYNYGVALQMANHLQEAARAYQRAIAMKPDLIDADFNLGVIFHKRGQHDAAARALEGVIRREPTRVEAHKTYLQVLIAAGRTSEWFRAFKRFEAACPNAFALLIWALEAYQFVGDFGAVDEYLRRLGEDDFAPANEADLVDSLEQLLFVILNFDADPEMVLRLYRTYNVAATSHYGGPLPRKAERRPGKLRIGYLSGDLRDHVMGKMMLEVAQRHDRARFEVRYYSTSSNADGYTERFRELADGFTVVADLGVTQAAERIAADDLDLLVDLSTHTKGAMQGILARKPARVQITHVASAGAVGLEAVDFKLTDPFADLPENAKWQLEKPLVMEGCVYPYRHVEPAAEHPFHRAALGIAADAVVIGAFVAPLKLSRRTLSLWRMVLERVPRAILAFSPTIQSMRPVYPRLLAAAGIPQERAIYLPQGRNDAERNARYRVVDFVLDTMPYGSVNGALEPLDMGVPIVTLCGRSHGERTVYSILSNLGVTQTIAHGGTEYIEIAARLAEDSAFMGEVRAAIAKGLAGSPLVDMAQHTRRLEDAYLRALEAVAPEAIAAAAASGA